MKEMKFIFCRCGRVHKVPIATLYNCLNQNKVLILACTNCGMTPEMGHEKLDDNAMLPIQFLDQVARNYER